MRKLRVGYTCNIRDTRKAEDERYNEWEPPETVEAVSTALVDAGCEVSVIDVGPDILHVLERRRLFPYLTVGQNPAGRLSPGARARRATTRAEVEALFPLLQAGWGQPAHTLSGGEQQMVAIARGLMACPTLLMIDEPFLGLAPQGVAQISQVITRLNRERGLTIVFIEQNVELALGLAHRGYVLESGRNILDGPSAALLQSAEVKRIFLGA